MENRGYLWSLDVMAAFFLFSLLVSLALPLFWQNVNIKESARIESAFLETDFLKSQCTPLELPTLISPLSNCHPPHLLDQNVAIIKIIFPNHAQILYEKDVPLHDCFSLRRIISFQHQVGILETTVCA